MNAKTLVNRVRALAEPLCAEGGVSLWDVTFEKEGRDMVLTVLIDRDEGIFIEDCERLSRALDPLLEAPEFDSLPGYTLSVSSAGLERALRTPAHFAWAAGKAVDLTFYRARDGRDGASGVLLRRDGEQTVLLEDGAERAYPNADVAHVRLHFEF